MPKDGIGSRFLSLIENEVPKKKTKKIKFGMLMEIKDELLKSREMGFSYKEISEYLEKVGVTVSEYQIRDFFVSELNEKVKVRRKKKPAASSKSKGSGSKQSLKTEEKKPNQPAPGFRVAGDDL